MNSELWGTATLSSRGQITIPKDVRDALFLTDGSKVEFRVKDGDVVLSAARPDGDPLDEWFGKYPLEDGSTDVVGWVREMRGWEEGEIDL